MSMDDALRTYVEESRELLEDMDSALMALETASAEDVPGHLDAIFRAVHTIKGSAGLFGLDDVVEFTHDLENVLDSLRDQTLGLSTLLTSTLFKCKDHLSNLIEEVAEGKTAASRELRQYSEVLTAELGASRTGRDQAESVGTTGDRGHGPSSGDGNDDNGESRRASLGSEMEAYFAEHFDNNLERVDSSDDEAAAATDQWHISLRFGRDSLRDGMDPLSFLRYLETLGEITHIVTVADDLPAATEMDPESCYLGFEIALRSEADKATIEDVFEFVREDSDIRILPPHSRIDKYIELLRSSPEADQRLGELLVECGSLTRHELESALIQQEELNEENESKPLGRILMEQGSSQEPVVEAAVEKQQETRRAKGGDSQSMRVDAGRLDELINLIGELVTTGAGTSLNARETGDSALIESMGNLTSLIESVRDATLKLRMVQIGATFNRFRRVVRDVSRELGKNVHLEIHGAETELDKTVVEKIGDPLMHLVRNAMDHGIEDAESRRAANKPETGTVTLNARHDSGTIVLEVSDDGGGLDPERIRAKAIEKAIITEDQVLNEQEILNLIFEPGFSTAASVTNLSGRGVGMDVVRSNINEVGGRIEVDSTLGAGTTIRIFMPLTLAIIDGFLIGIQEDAFVIPLESVLECVEFDTVQLDGGNRSVMNLRGEALPFIRLRDLFHVPGEPPARQNVVVVRHGNHKAGLVVDQLHGEFQTVIKPLGPIFSHLKGISGSTIMGNGQVALILDVAALVQRVTDNESIQLSA
jgi:two-component system chemotaxis sensor kinase CheA